MKERSSTAEQGYVDLGKLNTNETPGDPESNNRLPATMYRSERSSDKPSEAVVERNMPRKP